MDQQYARTKWPDPVAAEAEYMRLARLLYAMTDEQLQSAEADQIREDMELPWYAMSWEHGHPRVEQLCNELAALSQK